MSGLSLYQRIAQAIDYPTPAGDGRFAVDGMVLCAREDAGLPRLEYTICHLNALPDDVNQETLLEKFSEYALGAAARDCTTYLAYDADTDALFLWTKLPVDDSSPTALRDAFEHFADQCEWWKKRYGELTTPQPEFPGIIFRP